MQIAQEGAATNTAQSVSLPEAGIPAQNIYADYKIIRRNGSVVGFEPSKIAVAMTKAFLAVNGSQGAGSARVRELVAALTDTVVGALVRTHPGQGAGVAFRSRGAHWMRAASSSHTGVRPEGGRFSVAAGNDRRLA